MLPAYVRSCYCWLPRKDLFEMAHSYNQEQSAAIRSWINFFVGWVAERRAI